MHLDMTVHAVAPQQGLASRWQRLARQSGSAQTRRGMKLRHMTLLTQKWRALGQQVPMHRTVRLVAKAAILADWLVLPQERPALFGVTAKAGIVGGESEQIGRARTPMGIVAIGAAELTFADRMGKRPMQFDLLAAVTTQAGLALKSFNPHRIDTLMRGMAITAGQLCRIVMSSRPVHQVRLGVTGAADLILLVNAGSMFTIKNHIGGGTSDRRRQLGVSDARSVTACAADFGKPVARIGKNRMRRLHQQRYGIIRITMAAQAVGRRFRQWLTSHDCGGDSHQHQKKRRHPTRWHQSANLPIR